jgi:diguanylate cyclase (GGDEF)-like protein
MVVYLAILTPCLKGQFDFVYPYPDIASTRILASSVGLYVLILISEWIRVGSYSAITFTSENFREQANTDALTGLLNRHGVKSVLRRQEFEQPAVLALIDVDRFKSVNDSYGHDTGDEVLIALAKVLKANTKGGDVAARWGGEEFLLVLFGSNLQTSARLLEKIKSRFTAQCFQSSNQSFSSSFSAGLAELANAGDFEAAIRKADELLYQAKTTGRDHIVY